MSIDRAQKAIVVERLHAAITSNEAVKGHTHNYYKYPARFSPLFAREVIRQFSRPGQVVLDPFMGGGTTIVEALAMGRKAIGIDLNSLAHFVSTVKTTPLSGNDHVALRDWLHGLDIALSDEIEPVCNLPHESQRLLAHIMDRIALVPFPRQRRFLRCALLKTGQWAIDCKKVIPSSEAFAQKFTVVLLEMLEGAHNFVEACRHAGIEKRTICQNRLLLCRSTVGLDTDRRMNEMAKADLVVTSPPYASVHVLYHRWQVSGRRETPAPYWIAALKDGHPEAHYTFGSRSVSGIENYFRSVEDCFRSIRRIIARHAIVVQLIGFSDVESQLSRYLVAMQRAGFVEVDARLNSGDRYLRRNVPHRKFYSNGKEHDSAKEIVLFHRVS